MAKSQFITISIAVLLCWLGWTAGQTPAHVAETIDYEILLDSLLNGKEGEEAMAIISQVMEPSLVDKNWEAFTVSAIRKAQLLKQQKALDESLEQIDLGLRILKVAGLEESDYAARFWTWKALVLRMKQSWAPAADAYKTAIRIFEIHNSSHYLRPFAYKNLAQILQRLSDNRGSIRYLEAALRIDTAHEYTASICNAIANGYIFIDSIKKAIPYYERARNTAYPEEAAIVAFTGGELALCAKNWKEAQILYQKALAGFISDPEQVDNSIRSLSVLAFLADKQGQKEKAIQYYRKAEAFAKASYSTKSRELAKLYIETGRFYRQHGDWHTALHFFQGALIQVFPDFNAPDPSASPAVDQAYQESQAMDAAAEKAITLMGKPGITMQERLVAAHCFDLSFAIAAQLRQGFGDDADKMQHATRYKATVEKAAENLLAMHRESPDSSLLSRLFTLMEQFKAQALRDALNRKQMFAALPDSITEDLSRLTSELAIIRSSLQDYQLSGSNDSIYLQLLKKREFQLVRSYSDRIDALPNTFAWVDQLSRKEVIPDVRKVCLNLADTDAILSWLETGDQYLAIIARHHGLSVVSIPKDSLLQKQIADLVEMLPDREVQEREPEKYFTLANAVYTTLWPATALSGARKVTIIPDGLLCYLPFEALLVRPWSGRYGDAPYLIRDYNITYNWSATLAQPSTGSKGNMLFVAPFEKSGRDGLSALEKSSLEKPDNIQFDCLEGPTANVGNFLQKASGYNVMHLATHAHAIGSEMPGVELYDRTLTLPEILGQHFQASLVSLSACETGAGKYADGEGVLSLAYAFAYAGAQCLASSQWAVNESSTAQIFAPFYQILKTGESKGEALRRSKVDYLLGTVPDARKSPYYWAAFTLTGYDGPVVLSSQWPFAAIAVAGTIIALLSLLLVWHFLHAYVGKTTKSR